MDWLPLVLSGLVTAAALVVSVCLTIQTWENRRFARSRLAHKALRVVPGEAATVIVPCKGIDLRLAENLRRLFAQDHWPYELLLVVEAEEDPSAAVIDRLIAEHPAIPARRVVAGRARGCGQKVHNLRAALAAMNPATQVIAFVDSDAQTQPDWLRCLMQGLARPNVGAATGYRWFTPARPSLPNLILCSINAAVAAIFGPGGHNFVWGGSWAIRRERFEALKLAETWRGTLSDDLVATRVLKKHKLRIEFEPACLVASPLDQTWGQMTEFIRRQFLIGRCYVPGWWRLGFLGAALLQIVFWGGLVGLALSLWADAWWTPLTAACCTSLYLLATARAWMRQSIARAVLGGAESPPGMAEFDIVCAPVAGLFSLAGLAASLWGTHVTWRGVRYRIFHGGRIEVLDRSEASTEPPARQYRRAS